MYACVLVPSQRATSTNTAAERFNHLPFLRLDILVALKVNVMLLSTCHALPTGTQVWALEWVFKSKWTDS